MAGRTLSFALLGLAVAACDPNAWRDAFDLSRPGPEFTQWARRVIQECHPRTIGKETLDSRFGHETFLNLTWRLYSGRISVQQYTASVDSFYPGDNRAAIECIRERLPPAERPAAR
jgi:hypothetical protein